MQGKVAALCVALALGVGAFTPGAYADGSQFWSGETSQFLPMSFTLATYGGQTTIPTWTFEFVMICLDSGLIINLRTTYTGFDVPVVNGKFSFTWAQPWEYFSWSGR